MRLQLAWQVVTSKKTPGWNGVFLQQSVSGWQCGFPGFGLQVVHTGDVMLDFMRKIVEKVSRTARNTTAVLIGTATLWALIACQQSVQLLEEATVRRVL